MNLVIDRLGWDLKSSAFTIWPTGQVTDGQDLINSRPVALDCR